MINDYQALGWALVPIPKGTKGPNRKGWNLKQNCTLPADWPHNVGLAHAYSRTCAVDFDRLEDATKYLAEHGIDARALLDAPDAVQISSGRDDRAKLLYRLDAPFPSKKLAYGALELRSATSEGLTVQDVLPPSIHPETGQPYTWAGAGDFRQLPTIPDALLLLWRGLAEAKQNAEKFSKFQNIECSIEELRAILAANHTPNAPYDADEGDSFIKTGTALAAATNQSEEGFELWVEFLRPGIKFHEGEPNLRAHWRSFKPGKGITARWLWKGAQVTADEFVDDEDDLEEEIDRILAEPGTVTAGLSSPKAPLAEDRSAWPTLRRKKNGRIEPSYLNIHDAINCPSMCRMHLGYDEFRAEIMQAPLGGSLADLNTFGDNHYGELRRALEQRGFDSTGTDNVRQAVSEVAARNRFDSARDWLNSLEHDGVDRIPTFLAVYFGTDDTPYTRAVSLYMWTALAARVLTPGCQADMAPIFVGGQGLGKSKSIAALVPKPEQFVELDLDQSDDDLARLMSGCLVGELSELRGLSTRDLESIKSFITRKHDKWVPKYKEFANLYARRAILFGSTNKYEFLADETGERRFLPVEVHKASPDEIARDRLQLWAEARELFNLIGVAWQEAESLGREMVKRYKVRDSWEETIGAWLHTSEDGSGDVLRERVTTSEVASFALGIEPRNMNKGIEMRLQRVLLGFGYEAKQSRIDGKKMRYWHLSRPQNQ